MFSCGTKNIHKMQGDKKIDTLKKDKAYLSKVLKDGNNKARLIAEKNMKEVREIVGFL